MFDLLAGLIIDHINAVVSLLIDPKFIVECIISNKFKASVNMNFDMIINLI